MIRAEKVLASGGTWTGKYKLFVHGPTIAEPILDPDYQLGAPFKVEIQATEGSITVSYWKDPDQSTDPEIRTHAESGSSWFFKAGVYTQASSLLASTNDQYGTGYGEVIIYDLSVNHGS